MTENISSLSSNYLELRSDPNYLMSLITKHVKIQLIKETSISGYIISIDPITYSIILLASLKNVDGHQTTIIPGHAVLDVKEEKPSENSISPVQLESLTRIPTDDNLSERKQNLLAWFRWNLLPVSESDENIVFGNVTILPPYEVTDICTDNTIVAMQVTKLMQTMPENFNPTDYKKE